ncbi:MAG TPA: DUF1559 domain-containing protein [Thermoguttaceae bacterium]|nr:DUF1559 domain-containing protein [Thermoguttaceae bacterium]
MRRRTRRGFTLVELLVVITIIGMLVALVMPAILSSKEQARRTGCTNYQKQLGTAAAGYEATHGRLPAWNAKVGVQQANWFVALLLPLGNEPLYEEWKKGTPKKEFIAYMVCPSNPFETSARGLTPSAYLANADICRENKGIALSDVKDGVNHTILFSESLDDHYWDALDRSTVFAAGEDVKAHLSSKHSGVVIAYFCDGSARSLSEDINGDILKNLVNPEDGQTIDDADLE